MREAATQAVVDLLNDGGVTVGRGNKPDGGGWAGAPGQSEFNVYAIVWRIGGKDVLHRDLDGNFDEARPTFHLRTVGGTASEADVLLDTCDGLMKDGVTVPGYGLVHIVFDTSITTTKDDDVDPPVFYTGSYWRLWLQETP